MQPFESMEANNNGKRRKQDTENDNDDASRIKRSLRDVPPAHYTFKIESFSLFLKTMVENCESQEFEVGGYKWKLVLYPNGNKKKNVKGYISLYLTIADAKNLPLGWEVNVDFKFFVYDHIRDKYLVIQDPERIIRRFHRLNTELGFDELLSLESLNDASKGYLVGDCCVFGAEVFVVPRNGQGECLSMIKDPVDNIYTWKVSKLSSVKTFIFSDEFVVGEHAWKLLLYPKGEGSAEGPSLYLFLGDLKTHLPERKVYAECELRIKKQVHGKGDSIAELKHWFSTDPASGFGCPDLLDLGDLNDASKGFLVNDAMILEAKFKFVSSAKNL